MSPYDEGWQCVQYEIKLSPAHRHNTSAEVSQAIISPIVPASQTMKARSLWGCASREGESKWDRGRYREKGKSGLSDRPDSSAHLGWKGCGCGQSQSLVTCEVREHWSQIKANHPNDWLSHSDCQHPTVILSRTKQYSRFLGTPNTEHHYNSKCMTS